MKKPAIALAALSLLAAAPGDARAETLDESVRKVLHQPRYRFCHEDDYPLRSDEHAWCPLLGEHSGACPSLPKACKLPPVEPSPLFGRWRRGRWNGGPKDRAPVEDDRRRETRISLPDLSGLAQIVLAVLIAVFVGVVVRALAQNLLKGRGEPQRKDEPPPPDAGKAEAPARGPVETDVDRLLARARAAAERGDYGRAVDDCYAALLRRLDGDGLIEIHPSRTNGDYVRDLGSRADLRAEVREVVRDVEGIQFGATPASEPVFRSVLARVLPLVGRAASVLVVLLGLSTALSCTPHTGGDEAGGDTSPSGTQAILEVMHEHGVEIRRRGEPLTELSRPLALVLLPEVSLDEEAWKHVIAWVKDKGGRLIVAGHTSLPAEIEQRIVADQEQGTRVTVAHGVHWVGRPTLSLPPGARVAPSAGSDYSVEGVVLLREDSPVLTERTVGAGRVVMVADERLFTNAALTADDDAQLLLALLYRSSLAPDHEVEICDGLTGAGAKTPLSSLHQAHLTPVVVQILILVALLFLWKGRAFARLRDPPAEVRRTFADHARALGLSYQRARASRYVTGLYAVWALERLRERVHRAGRQGLIPLAEAIAARTGRPEGEIMSVLVEAAGARDEAAPPSSFRPRSRREGAAAAKAVGAKDPREPDLALMRELMGFLAVTGSRRPPEPPTPPR